MKKFLALPLALFAGGCLTPPPPPAAPYRAIGTEPFWNVLIDAQHVTYTSPETEPLRQPAPRPTVSAAGQTYQTPRITVTISRATCSDGMSDRVYPDMVRVTVDGRQLSGCGGL